MKRRLIPSLPTLCGPLVVSGWLLILASSAIAGEWINWKWINPLPQGYGLYAATAGADIDVAVGNRGTVLTSVNGLVWDIAVSGDEHTLIDVVWTGSLFVGVGGGGGAVPVYGVVLTSPDGLSWTEQHRVDGVWLGAALWNGSQVLAVGSPGISLTSPDGIIWTDHHLTGDLDESVMVDVTWDGSRYLAVGLEYYPWWPDPGQPAILESVDGSLWSRIPFDAPPNFRHPSAVSWGLGVFVVVGGSEDPIVSEDGVSWANATVNWPGDPDPRGLYDVVFADGRFAASSGWGSFAVSDDGLSWTAYDAPKPWGSSRMWGLSHLESGYLTVGAYGFMASSVDGREWTEISSGFSASGIADLDRHNGTYYGVGFTRVLRSEYGYEWTIQGISGVDLNSVRGLGDAIWATSSNGKILRSTAGLTWELMNEGGWGGSFYDIAGSDRLIVAVGFASDPYPGAHPVVATSHDGAEWSFTRFPWDVPRLNSVAWTGERFVVVGGGGRVVTSTDGESWTTTILGESLTFRRIAWSGDRLAAVGDGIVATSRDGIDWELLEVPGTRMDDVTWTGRQFVATARVHGTTGGWLLTSRDGVTWNHEPVGFGIYPSCVEGDGNELVVGAEHERILRADHVSATPRRGGRRVVPGQRTESTTRRASPAPPD